MIYCMHTEREKEEHRKGNKQKSETQAEKPSVYSVKIRRVVLSKLL